MLRKLKLMWLIVSRTSSYMSSKSSTMTERSQSPTRSNVLKTCSPLSTRPEAHPPYPQKRQMEIKRRSTCAGHLSAPPSSGPEPTSNWIRYKLTSITSLVLRYIANWRSPFRYLRYCFISMSPHWIMRWVEPSLCPKGIQLLLKERYTYQMRILMYKKNSYSSMK